jgi:hypothetical protein
MLKKAIAVCLLGALLVPFAIAQEPAAESQLEFSFAPRFWGLSVGTSYALEPPQAEVVETRLIGVVSAALESVSYFRYPDGSLYDSEGVVGRDSFYRTDLWWQLGVQQGIYPRYDSSDDLAVVFAYYRGRFDEAYIDSGLLGSVHAGLAFSNIADNEVTATRRGLLAEFVIQWGPPFLHNSVRGSADFTRTTVSTRAFLPLWEAEPRENMNWSSGYLAAFAAVDWATGPAVPWQVRSTIGTRSERSGPGGSVRGFGVRRFDATLKAVANLELRANLREFSLPWILPNVVPGLIAFTDAGYFNDLDERSPNEDEQSGTLFSAGGGFYLDIVGIAEILLYTTAVWPAAANGRHWVPVSLGLGFHF